MAKAYIRKSSAKWISVVIAAMVLAIGPVAAQSSGGQRQVPMGYCYSSSLATAQKIATFTCNIVGGGTVADALASSQYASVCAYSSGIVWRDDGVAPTATPGSGGQGVSPSSCFSYNGTPSAMQFIGQAGGATVGVLLYR